MKKKSIFSASFFLCCLDCWHRLVLLLQQNYIFMSLFMCFFYFIFQAGFVDTLYSWSAFNTEELGDIIAESLKILIRTYPIEKIHLIGESKQYSCKLLLLFVLRCFRSFLCCTQNLNTRQLNSNSHSWLRANNFNCCLYFIVKVTVWALISREVREEI